MSKHVCVRKHIPHPTPINPNHHYWERTYLQHILDLENIFLNGLQQLDITQYPSFHDFSCFIFEYSSKYITDLVDPLPPALDEKYLEYTIKRDSIINNK